MYTVIVMFFNLVTGAHENSEEFWQKRVPLGVKQRFGDHFEGKKEIPLHEWVTQNAEVGVPIMKLLLERLTEITGIVLNKTVRSICLPPFPSHCLVLGTGLSRTSCTCTIPTICVPFCKVLEQLDRDPQPLKFEFVIDDIEEIRVG